MSKKREPAELRKPKRAVSRREYEPVPRCHGWFPELPPGGPPPYGIGYLDPARYLAGLPRADALYR